MEIICQSCQGKLKIPNEKLPPGRAATVTCPRCKAKINVSPSPKEEKKDAGEAFEDLFDFEDDSGESYDATEKPFDFIEEEGKSALICESDAIFCEKVRPTLDLLEYHVTEVPYSREALKKMRYHTYDVIILDEYFDTQDPEANPVLIFLERLGMDIRRNIFVVLLSQRYRTMDNMTAFQKSVNMIVNVRNIDDFDKILQRGLADYGLFFKVMKESLTD
jgi:CheY-like chemotaxis protein